MGMGITMLTHGPTPPDPRIRTSLNEKLSGAIAADRIVPDILFVEWRPRVQGIADMTTFVLIHGGGDVGWYWHLLETELRSRGHDVIAPDLPCDDDSAGLAEYADSVVEAVGGRRDLVVVGQSYGGFTAPLVAAPVPVDGLVLLGAMVPSPGETPEEGGKKPHIEIVA